MPVVEAALPFTAALATFRGWREEPARNERLH
jgi:hypothetical protein